MAQYGRPVADITVGAWTTSPLWDKLDEISADDATTEITTGNNPSNVTGEVRLGSVTDPNLDTGHVLRIRAYTTNSCTLVWALYQGTALIANCGTITLGGSYTTSTYNLTEAEANAITNYSDLRVRFTGNGQGRARVTWIEAQFPDQLIQKSGTATISGGKTISAAIRKAALVAAVIGVLGHVAATGMKAYPLLIHGGGTVAVAGAKGVWSDEGTVGISGGGTAFATGKKGAFNQDFVTHAIDTFHRLAEGSFLGDDPDWSDGGSIKVKSGGIYCEVFGNGSNLYLGGSVPPADHYVQATVRGEGDNAFCGLIIREHYTCWFRDMFGDIVFWRDGAFIEQYPYLAFQVGDTIALSVSGSTITALVNGVPIRSWVDGTYSSGRAGVVLYGPSSGGAPVQLDDFIIGYNRGIFVSGNGNVYVWSEDKTGSLTISGNGTVAVVGAKGVIGTGIVPGIRADFTSGMDDGWSSDVTGSGSVTVSGGNAVVVTTVAADEAIVRYDSALNESKNWDFKSRFRVISGLGVNATRGFGIYQNPVIPPASIEIAAYRIEVQQNAVSGLIIVRYRNASDQHVMWDYTSQTWKTTGFTHTPGTLGNWHTVNFLSDEDGWHVEVRDQTDTLIVNTSQVAWSATKETTDPYWFFVGESAFNTYSASYYDYLDLGGAGTGPLTISGGGMVAATSSMQKQGSASISGGGPLSGEATTSHAGTSIISGGGTAYASATENVWKAVAISGGGAVTLAGRAGTRRAASIHGGGTISLTVRAGLEGQPTVNGNGVLTATGDATFIDTASVFAVIHGGGSVNAAGNKWNDGTAWTFGGGRVSVHYDRSWESVPIQKIDSPDSVCYLIKMEMDYCSRTFGISPCLATGTRCYNTWKTCKYIAAYLATKKTYRFVSANFPQAFPDARPYIADVKYMPTEIKTNLTVNARVSFSMLDEPDADVDTDPYWSTRSSHPGTYWKRWLARNTNYKDRIVRIYEGVYGRPESTYVQKWTGRLENIKIKGDKFTFEAVDLLKDLAKIEIPPKTNAKLALALAANAGQSFTITEDADKFPFNGYVRIDDEIIQYTALNVATKTFTIGGIANRAQFGTVGAAHAQSGKVQQAKFYAAKNPLEILLDILLGDAGMADSWVETANVNNVNVAFTTTSAYVELGVAGSQSWPSVGIMKLENWPTPGVIEYVRYASKTYVPGGVGVSPAWRFNFETYSGVVTGRALFGTPRITGGVNSIRAEIGYFEYVDTDAFYQYRDWPARDIDFTSIVSEPTKLSDLYMEVVDLLDAKSWVAENLKITIRKNTTNTPTTGYVSLSDADNIIEDSGSVDVNEKSRISRMTVYWDKVATGKASDEMSYRRLDIAIDPDAETNYGDPVEKVVKSRWIDPYVTLEETVQQFVKNLAIRRIQRCKHAQNLITVKVPEKDAGVNTGDYVRLSTDELLESDGLPISARMYQVVKRERSDKAVTLTFIQVTPRRMAVIAPAGLPAYPSATDAQRAYAFICDATGKMSDGTDGYFIW